MKREGKNEDRMDFSFKVPDTGDYRFQFDEGIKIEKNEKSGKRSLWLPAKVVECKSGQSEENIDLQVTHFVPIETDFGAKQIEHILGITGLFEAFDKKFPGDNVDMTSEEFINALKLKLPGKLFDGGIETKEKDGKKLANFKYIEKMGAGNSGKGKSSDKSSGGSAAKSAPPTETKDKAAEEDW